MTLVLELPAEVETELAAAAQARGVAVELVAVERLRSSTNGAALPLSPLGAALQLIRENPIRSNGPVDAVADLEEVRAARMNELAR